MPYTEKFQALADAAIAQVEAVAPEDVDALVVAGALPLDIRDKEEHEAGSIPGSLHVSRGKLEMNIEGAVPDLDRTILCYCFAMNRGALSAATLRAMGYANAKFVAGGYSGYKKAASDRVLATKAAFAASQSPPIEACGNAACPCPACTCGSTCACKTPAALAGGTVCDPCKAASAPPPAGTVAE